MKNGKLEDDVVLVRFRFFEDLLDISDSIYRKITEKRLHNSTETGKIFLTLLKKGYSVSKVGRAVSILCYFEDLIPQNDRNCAC